MNVWALVPARGGSKSIPRKNLIPLLGVPLLDYGVRATQAAGCVHRIICSTDDDDIARRALALGIEVDRRPPNLGEDTTPVADVAVELLRRRGTPDVLVLVQPTSPFLLPEHVRRVVAALAEDATARSAQTVTCCPHNYHAWNHREVTDGRVRFRFAEERLRAYNKQVKPALHVFGNLVAVRPAALFSGAGFFAEPSAAVEIPAPYNFDLDVALDAAIAEALLRAGTVSLPHMRVESPTGG